MKFIFNFAIFLFLFTLVFNISSRNHLIKIGKSVKVSFGDQITPSLPLTLVPPQTQILQASSKLSNKEPSKNLLPQNLKQVIFPLSQNSSENFDDNEEFDGNQIGNYDKTPSFAIGEKSPEKVENNWFRQRQNKNIRMEDDTDWNILNQRGGKLIKYNDNFEDDLPNIRLNDEDYEDWHIRTDKTKKNCDDDCAEKDHKTIFKQWGNDFDDKCTDNDFDNNNRNELYINDNYDYYSDQRIKVMDDDNNNENINLQNKRMNILNYEFGIENVKLIIDDYKKVIIEKEPSDCQKIDETKLKNKLEPNVLYDEDIHKSEIKQNEEKDIALSNIKLNSNDDHCDHSTDEEKKCNPDANSNIHDQKSHKNFDDFSDDDNANIVNTEFEKGDYDAPRDDPVHKVTVTGFSHIKVNFDEITVGILVRSLGSCPNESFEKNEQTIQKIIFDLKKNCDINKNDVTISHFPTQKSEKIKNKEEGYFAETLLEVTVCSMDLATNVIDSSIANGAKQIRFVHKNGSEKSIKTARKGLIQKAIKNAEKLANLSVNNLGFKIKDTLFCEKVQPNLDDSELYLNKKFSEKTSQTIRVNIICTFSIVEDGKIGSKKKFKDQN